MNDTVSATPKKMSVKTIAVIGVLTAAVSYTHLDVYKRQVFNIKIPKNLLYTKECYSVQKRRGAAGERWLLILCQ